MVAYFYINSEGGSEHLYPSGKGKLLAEKCSSANLIVMFPWHAGARKIGENRVVLDAYAIDYFCTRSFTIKILSYKMLQ